MHNKLQTRLKEQIQRYASSQGTGWQIETEHYINPSTFASSRRADVAVLTENLPYNGYGVEIKTGDWSVQVLLHQVRDYLLTGYVPLILSSQRISEKTLDSKDQCPVGWILDFLSVSVVEPIRSDEIQFELREDRLNVNDPLRDFFEN